MSRFRRMVHNVASSYVSLIAASLFSLATVPLALHYLGAESGRFALWLLMSSITGYMSLIDLGMSGSVARLLIDYKDQRDEGEYGSLIKTGGLVLLVQAAIILLAGLSLAPLLAWVLKIDPELRAEFIGLLGWQSGSLALAFSLRIFSQVLQAHQRGDIQNYSQVFGFVLNFFLMLIFFRAGYGVYSLAWATLGTTLYGGMVCLGASWRLQLLPARGAWGKVCGARFRELFRYGQDMFLVALGTQLIMASQILIIQRTLGSVSATLWGVGTRIFTLILQIISRISDMAGPAFSEMIVRNEREKLQARFRDSVILTGSLGAFFAVGFALCNSTFVTVWTNGKIEWPAINDLGLGLWLAVICVFRCHNLLIIYTKQIGFMRYIYFLEGAVFVMAALWTATYGGFLAIVGCSIVCSCGFSGAYGFWRVSHYLGKTKAELVLGWQKLMARTILLTVPVALITWYLAQPISLPLLRLIFCALIYGALGLGIFLRFGLPENFRQELARRAPRAVQPILGRILV